MTPAFALTLFACILLISTWQSHGLPAPLRASNQVSLNITIERANNINAGDNLSSDPYVQLFLGDKLLGQTHPVFGTVNPVWNDAFEYQGLPNDGTLRFRLWDYDFESNDDSLGESLFALADTLNVVEGAVELPVRAEDKQAGTLLVRYSSSRLTEDLPYVKQIGPVHYTKRENGPLWSTFEVHLHNVAEHFNNTLTEWNKDYPAIQIIFGDDVVAPLLRAAVKAEHNVLYRQSPSATYGTLQSADALVGDLLANGMRDGKPVMYTYVLTEDGSWNFSETGASFLQDAVSKHMVHSGAAFAVYYSGEFHIRQEPDGGHTLVLDNNSGTYSPPTDRLSVLQKLMAANFPGIRCEAVDRNDPAVVKARDAIFAAWEQ